MSATKEHYFKEITAGLENVKIISKIEYYENKLNQWNLLDSLGEDWEDCDIVQKNEWIERIKFLKGQLI